LSELSSDGQAKIRSALPRWCYEMWKATCKRVGIEMLPYDLRRTVVCNLRAAGIPERTIMQITGHETREMFDRYGIVDERDMRTAFEATERHLEALPKERKVVAFGPGSAKKE